MTIIPSETRIEQAREKHNSTIIFFHGMGSSNNVGHFNSNMQEKFPHTNFVFPQASKKEWKVKGMFSSENINWYCIETTREHLFTPNPPQTIAEVEEWGKEVKVDENHLRSLISEVHKIIQAEIDKGIKPENIILAGYSQGGSAALATGLTFPKPLGGIISLSSFLPWSSKTYNLLNNASPEKKNVPIIFCNGTDDGLVPFWTGEMSAKILKLCGYSKIEFHGYPGQGHSTNCDKELNNFLEGVLTRKRKETSEGDNSNDFPKTKKPKIEEEGVKNNFNNNPVGDNPEISKDLKSPQVPTLPAENSNKNQENKNQEKPPQEKEKPTKKDIDYKTWTQEQLISEINRLKAEIQALKNNQTLTSSEREKKLWQNQQELEKLLNIVKNITKNSKTNNIPTGLVIGGMALLTTIGLTTLLAFRNKKFRSYKSGNSRVRKEKKR